MKTKKYFLAAAAVFFSVLAAHGMYLKNVPQKLTQPDGTIVHCFATGDEFYNWLHDSAGYTIVQDQQTGYYVYAVESDGDLLPTAYVVGKVNPMTLALEKEANISVEKRMEIRKSKEMLIPKQPVHKAGTTNHGHINNLVFFIRFSDEDSFDGNFYNELVARHNDYSLGDSSRSMHNYYKLASYNKFSVTTSFYPSSSSDTIYSFQDIYPRSYYKAYSTSNPNGYTSSNQAIRKHDLLKRVIEFFADSVPANLDLDFDGDGFIDNVCFITSGTPENWSDLLWPHRSWYYGENVSINKKRLRNYNFVMETYTNVGTLTHEFFHTLGAPDLYRYNYSATPVGRWDLMASTSNLPQGLGVYMKHKYGNWIESIPVIEQPGTYTLYPANGASPNKTAYILSSSPGSSQYLLLEYRKTNSNIFEGSLPGSGILIYRINDEYNGNGSSDDTHYFDEVYLFRPGGTTSSEGNLNTAHFASDFGRTAFNLTTNPSPFYSEGSYMSSIMITNITEVGDSIQFTVSEVMDTLEVSTNEVVLNCASGSKGSFAIHSNAAWMIIGEHQWLSVGTPKGKCDRSITLTATSQNGTDVDRVCTLSIRTGSYYNPVVKQVVVRHKSCNSGLAEQTNLNNRVVLVPNPVSELLSVHYHQIGEFTENDVAVYSVQGQKIQIPVLHFQPDKIQLNVNTLSSGIYYMKIQTSKGTIVKSFSVSK